MLPTRNRIRFVFFATLLCLASAAHAKVKIDVNGVTKQLEQNVRAFLSLSRYNGRDDLDEDAMTRFAARIPSETRSALQPLGYYEPQVQYAAMRENDKDWRISIDITLGRAVRLSEVKIAITGPGQDERALQTVLDRRDLREGRRLDHGTYDTVKSELFRLAVNNGYLDARWTRSELLIDAKERRATVDLELETGPRYRFGEITVEQNVVTDDKMRRLLRMKAGDPFTLDAVLQSQYVLDDSQYFSQVTVETEQRDAQTLTVPIKVTAKPNKRNSYRAGIGYGTDTKTRGKLTWDNRLLNQRGHRSTLEYTGSAIGYEATARYIIPVLDIALEKLEFAYTKQKQELADATSYQDELSTGLTQVLGSWQRVLFVRLQHETSEYPDHSERTFLIIPGISFATLPTYILGQTQRRWAFSGELSGSPSSLGSGASYVRLLMQGERIFDLSEIWHLDLRAQLGSIWTDDFSKVPASERFFAGGDNSVRGFGLNELSPLDDAGKRVGASHLVVGTVEFQRDLPRNFRAAVFYDIGNAINHFSDPLEYSVGVGLRWHISIASFGVDVAQPLSESGRTPRLHLHISTLF